MPTRPKNIILVTIDTLRADRVGCYGCPRPTTPVLDALAAEGAMFRWAFAPAPYTVPSHISMLTGLYPSNHDLGLVQKEGVLDTDATVMLQECLKAEGYRTGAFVSSVVLRKGFRLDCGFDVYDDTMTATEINRASQPIRDGRQTNEAALAWMRQNRDGGMFVWVHYFDAHGPYVQPEGFEGPFSPGDFGEAPVKLDMVEDGLSGGIPMYQALGAVRDETGKMTSCELDMRSYLAGYDNGVRYQDMVFGEFLDSLREMGIYDDSMIVVTSDHGEAMGEEGVYFFHGLTVTPDQVMVPLIVKPHAGGDQAVSGQHPVGLVDIMPTVLDAAGFDRGGLRLDGVPLFAPDPGRIVHVETEWQRGLARDGAYLVSDKEYLYDGYEYYFDSRSLLKGDRLWMYEAGDEVPVEGAEAAAPLLERMERLRYDADPKENRIKSRDRRILELDETISENRKALKSKDDIIAHKDKYFAETVAHKDKVLADTVALKDGQIAERDGALAGKLKELSECETVAYGLNKELERVYGSSSWKLTYPLRWISARLKGQRPRN